MYGRNSIEFPVCVGRSKNSNLTQRGVNFFGGATCNRNGRPGDYGASRRTVCNYVGYV